MPLSSYKMPKVLVLRSNVEALSTVLSKLEQLNGKAGPFDCAILLGHIIESDKDLEGKCSAVPTFFTNGRHLLSDCPGSQQLGTNLTLLNGYGVYKTSSGIRVGYITGDQKFSEGKKEEIQSTFQNAGKQGIDLLITDDLSKPVSDSMGSDDSSSPIVDFVLTNTHPKYHFSATGNDAFQEIAPFKWANTNDTTRCLNLAQFDSGAKWAYAFTVATGVDNQDIPQTLGKNPYEVEITNKRTHESENADNSRISKKPKQVLPEECRFCFSNSSIEDHLIISIGEHAYLTTAKGPLTLPTSNMNFPGHCLVIPIKHIPKMKAKHNSSADLSNDPFWRESQKYEEAIAKMNFTKFEMGTVAFEINSENSIHYHKQIIPVPKYLINKFTSALERQVHFNNTKYTNNAQLEFQEFNGPNDEGYRSLINDYEQNYLQFSVYEGIDGAPPKIYVATFKPDERIDLQFGRRVVAFVLRLPKRAKWDSPACRQTLEQEKNDVREFQKHFKEYE